MTIKIVLIDECVIFRSGLKKYLADQEIEIIGEAGNGAQGQRLVQQKQPNIVLLDLPLPDTTGIQVCDYVQQHFPRIHTLFLLGTQELPTLNRLLHTSAKGLITKNSRYPVIDAVKTVHDGGRYLQPDVAWDLIRYREKHPHHSSHPLTDREYQIMTLIARGKTYEEIAGIAHVSLKTVSNIKSNICKKLGIKNPADWAKRGGLGWG